MKSVSHLIIREDGASPSSTDIYIAESIQRAKVVKNRGKKAWVSSSAW